jgi:hypothetical protein
MPRGLGVSRLNESVGGEGGLEPPVRLHILRISSAARSTTLPLLLKACLVARNCHPGELGAAMHRLGFARKRDWSGADGFRAVWRRV